MRTGHQVPEPGRCGDDRTAEHGPGEAGLPAESPASTDPEGGQGAVSALTRRAQGPY